MARAKYRNESKSKYQSSSSTDKSRRRARCDGVMPVDNVQLKELLDVNEQLKITKYITIRKCIACRQLFESVGERNCGCLWYEFKATSSLMGHELILG